MRDGTNKVVMGNGSHEFDVFGKFFFAFIQFDIHSILTRPVLNFPLQRLVRNEIGGSEWIASDGAKVVSLIEPIHNGLAFKMRPVPADHWILHDRLGHGTNKLGGRDCCVIAAAHGGDGKMSAQVL